MLDPAVPCTCHARVTWQEAQCVHPMAPLPARWAGALDQPFSPGLLLSRAARETCSVYFHQKNDSMNRQLKQSRRDLQLAPYLPTAGVFKCFKLRAPSIHFLNLVAAWLRTTAALPQFTSVVPNWGLLLPHAQDQEGLWHKHVLLP